MLSTQEIERMKADMMESLAAGKLDRIKRLYRKCRNERIADPDLWMIFASANSQSGNYKEVIDCCDHIIDRDPRNLQAHYNRGVAYQLLGKNNRARSAFDECIRIAPDYMNAYRNAASLCRMDENLDGAIDYYEALLRVERDTDTLMALAKCLDEKGDLDTAVSYYEEVLTRSPNDIEAMFNLAQNRFRTKDLHRAEKLYLKLSVMLPNDPRILNNLGRLYEESRIYDRALSYYEKALPYSNDKIIIQRNIANTLYKKGDHDSAEQVITEYLNARPDDLEHMFNLASIYESKGSTDQAIKLLERIVAHTANNASEEAAAMHRSAGYHLSYLTEPDKFDDRHRDFVSNVFDECADRFESILVDSLGYSVPEVIADYINRIGGEGRYYGIDLGCGTGLCAKHLQDRFESLTGIDISPNMLKIAGESGLYDRLICGEITEEIASMSESYDLIIAADVFIYIGGLDSIFRSIGRISKPGALFIFSIETIESSEQGYRLIADTGRYKHTQSYIERLCERYRFDIKESLPCDLRKEQDTAVEGVVYTLQINNG